MKKYFITGLLAMALLIVFVGCNNSNKQQETVPERNAVSTPTTVPETPAVEEEATPVATDEQSESEGSEVAGDEAGEAEENAVEGVETEEEGTSDVVEEEAGEGEAESGQTEEVAEETSTEEVAEPAIEEETENTEEGIGEEEPVEEEASEVVAETEETEVGAVDETEEVVEEDVPVDPISQFKALDPREIIDRKYEDLQEQHTTPWDEDSEEYIHNTGRIDPLTRVREAVPDELKPPRAGDDDENEIQSYAIARDATMIAYQIAYNMQCMSVMQIGIEKWATLSVFGNSFTMSEGDTAGPFQVGYSSGVPLVATLSCSSIGESEVRVNITVSGEGTNTSISKSQTFIPNTWR